MLRRLFRAFLPGWNRQTAQPPGRVEVLGVHPVQAPEPCHLIELLVTSPGQAFDLCLFTQPMPGKPRSSWQVPYMDVLLNSTGTKAITDVSSAFSDIPELLSRSMRMAFYFHYLQADQPLLTPFGAVKLPAPTPVPDRLTALKYIPVD